MFQKIFLLGVLFLVSIISIHADTNGVWTYSEDIRAGIFGADEGNPTGSNYTFNDIVYFNQDLIYKSELIEDLFVNTSGDTMSGNLDMDNNRITNLPSPSGPNQPTTLEYSDNNYVNEAGDSMSGNLDMGGNTISNINRLITNPSTSDYLGGVFAESYFTRGAGTSYYLRPAGNSIINNLDVIGTLELNGVDINDIFVNEGQSDSISNTMLQDNSVTGDKIAIGSVGGDKLVSNYESGSVYDSRFVNEGQANSISSGMIQNNAVGESEIADNSVGIQELNTGSTDNRYVNRNGDSMNGNLNMGGNRITNLPNPVSSSDVANKAYVDSSSSDLGNCQFCFDYQHTGPYGESDSVCVGFNEGWSQFMSYRHHSANSYTSQWRFKIDCSS